MNAFNFITLTFLISFILIYGLLLFVLSCENFHRRKGTKRITVLDLIKEYKGR